MAEGTIDRRQLLCHGCAWAVAGLASGCVVGGVGGGPNGGGGGTDNDDDSGFPDNPWDTGTMSTGIDAACAVNASTSWAELPFSQFPELESVGGWVQTQVGGRTLNVAHVEDGCYVAMETACTHEGARVDYRPERQQFVCTRHGAVYVPSGEPIAGPTPIALATYPAARSGSSVWVQV